MKLLWLQTDSLIADPIPLFHCLVAINSERQPRLALRNGVDSQFENPGLTRPQTAR